MNVCSGILKVLALITLSLTAVATPIDTTAFGSWATLINFDELAGGNCLGCGTQVTNQYSLFGLVFENPSYPGQATAQTDLTYGVPDATGNILWVRQGGAIVDPPAEPFRLLFSSGVNMVGFNYASSADAYLFVEVYNNDQLVESAVYIGSATPIGWGGFAGLQLPASFNRLDLSYHPISDPTRTLNFSVDNVQFQGTPEPSSLILGLLGLSGIAWRRFRLRE